MAWSNVLSVLFTVAGTPAWTAPASTEDQAQPIEIRAVVVTAFEIGSDTAGERQP